MDILLAVAKSYPNIAFLYALIGNISNALLQIFVKQASHYLNSFQLIVCRSILLIAFNFWMLKRTEQSPYIKSPRVFRLVLIRISYMCIGTVTMFFCLNYLPVSTVTTLYNTGPLFVFFLQQIQYKKKMDKTSLTLALLSFAGVVLIIQPSFLFGKNSAQIDYFAGLVLLMLMAAFGNAMNKLYTHMLAKKVSPAVNVQYSHIGFLMLGGLLCNFEQNHFKMEYLTLQLLLLTFLIALSGLFSQYFVFAANTLKKPSYMMPFGYASVATGFIADIYLFGAKMNFTSIVGILLTSAGLLGQFLLIKQITVDKKDVNKLSNSQKQLREQSTLDLKDELIKSPTLNPKTF